jgi:5-methylthioadenosine/S-adenosylhomocysteine deaminase
MSEEMRVGATIQKLHNGDSAAMPCKQMLRLATMGSGQALGLAGEIGSLEAGKKADLIILDLNAPHLWPVLRGVEGNVIQHLVYSANAADVRTTIVKRQVLMEDRQVHTLDPEDVFTASQDAALSLLRRGAVPRKLYQFNVCFV